jgi:alpha-methylacyl-CoA racemase
LEGVTVVELGGIGPGPFCGMMLADNGARVIRVERPGAPSVDEDVLARSREIITLDLKVQADIARLLSLVADADGLIEGMRPGTLERLGIGPERLLSTNPRLVVCRMTGWGQTGPYAQWAGHDINYVAISGALHAIGPAEKPVPPLALVGDFGGGGMMCAFAMTAAILHSLRTGQGQVVDCAMIDGVGLLMTAFYSLFASGEWKDQRDCNIVDGGAHFYGVYETSDGRFISLAPIEPQFYALLLEKLQLADDQSFADQLGRKHWPLLRQRLASIFRTKTRDEWCSIMECSDVCFAPVLSLAEAPLHAHALARNSFLTMNGITQPAPAPRYSATPLDPPRVPRSVDPVTITMRKQVE